MSESTAAKRLRRRGLAVIIAALYAILATWSLVQAEVPEAFGPGDAGYASDHENHAADDPNLQFLRV